MGFVKKLFDVLNLESRNEIEEIIGNEITVFFINGKLYKVSPQGTKNYYDARFLVSDNKLYDLGKVDDIKKIPIPNFKPIENDNYGVTGMLDYVLRMKSRYFYQRKENELCSACLWKATEMMFANPLCSWRKEDYTRILKYHILLGMDKEAEKAKKYLESKGMIFTDYELEEMKPIPKNPKAPRSKKGTKKEKIDWREKELAIVKNTNTSDMKELKMPFICNTDVKKYIQQGNHPLAYMEIVKENINIVKTEINKMNVVIKENIKEYPKIPQNLKIPANELVFNSPNYEYTRLICTPKTYEGNPSKIPYTLYFCTDLSKRGNTTHGELAYGQDGNIQNAKVIFWRNSKQFVLSFKMLGEKLTLTNIGQGSPKW